MSQLVVQRFQKRIFIIKISRLAGYLDTRLV